MCHWLVIASDANLSLTSNLILLFWTAFMSHICYLILMSHHCLPPENNVLLSVMISSATITLLCYSEGYLQLCCFSLLDPGSNFHALFVCICTFTKKISPAAAFSSSSCSILRNSCLPHLLCACCPHCLWLQLKYIAFIWSFSGPLAWFLFVF